MDLRIGSNLVRVRFSFTDVGRIANPPYASLLADCVGSATIVASYGSGPKLKPEPDFNWKREVTPFRQRVSSILWLAPVLAGLILLFFGFAEGGSASVVLEWSTVSELDTLGFHIYRSSEADGSYTRVTEQLIPASDDPLTGGDYSFTDLDVQAGRTYYYQLEDVETSGATERHGPLQVQASGRGAIPYGAGGALLALGGFLWFRRRQP